MTIQVTYELKDLKEALSPNPTAGSKSKRSGLIGWVLFIFLATMLYTLLNSRLATSVSPVSNEFDRPEQNLWLTVVPGAIPAIWMLALLVIAIIGTLRRPGLPKNKDGGWLN